MYYIELARARVQYCGRTLRLGSCPGCNLDLHRSAVSTAVFSAEFSHLSHVHPSDGQQGTMLQAISFVDREVAERALREEKKQRKKEKKKEKKVGRSTFCVLMQPHSAMSM